MARVVFSSAFLEQVDDQEVVRSSARCRKASGSLFQLATPPRRRRPTRQQQRAQRQSHAPNRLKLWVLLLITPGLVIYALQWAYARCASIGLCAASESRKRAEELPKLAIMLTRQVAHAQTVFSAVMALGNPVGRSIQQEMHDLKSQIHQRDLLDNLQPFFESTNELSKALEPIHNITKSDITKAVERISRAADIDIPNLRTGSLWLYNRAHPTSFILSDSLTRLAQPFSDISLLVDHAIPIAEKAATRARDATREVSHHPLKEEVPERLKLSLQNAPVIHENLRLIQDYLRWYSTLSHDAPEQSKSRNLKTTLSNLRSSVAFFREEWPRATQQILPHPVTVTKEVPLTLVRQLAAASGKT